MVHQQGKILDAIAQGRQINPKDIEGYKKIARFYLQCERYEEARQILENLLASLPDQADLKKQLEPSLRAIQQPLHGVRQLLASRLGQLPAIPAFDLRHQTPQVGPAQRARLATAEHSRKPGVKRLEVLLQSRRSAVHCRPPPWLRCGLHCGSEGILPYLRLYY